MKIIYTLFVLIVVSCGNYVSVSGSKEKVSTLDTSFEETPETNEVDPVLTSNDETLYPPVIQCLVPSNCRGTVSTTQSMELSVTANDPDGGRISITWEHPVNTTLTTKTGDKTNFTSNAAGDYTITAIVQDNEGDTKTINFYLIVIQTPPPLPSYVSEFHEVAFENKNKVDVLWVVDNSGSMGSYQTNMANNFTSFISNFTNHNLDYHIGVISTDNDATYTNPKVLGYGKQSPYRNGKLVRIPDMTKNYLDLSTPNIIQTFSNLTKLGISGSVDEQALTTSTLAFYPELTSIHGHNYGFLRDDATLVVVVLSDEHESKYSNDVNRLSIKSSLYWDYTPEFSLSHDYCKSFKPGQYITNMKNIKQNKENAFIFFSIINLKHFGSCTFTKINDLMGTPPINIDDTNYAKHLDQISNETIKTVTSYVLRQTPRVDTIQVNKDGVVIPKNDLNGYSYLSLNNSIRFNGSYIPKNRGLIEIKYIPN